MAGLVHDPAGRPIRRTAPVRSGWQELAALRHRRANVDLDALSRGDPAFHVDAFCQPLVTEPPGDPVPGGAWRTACELLEAYEVADPRIVRALYYTDVPFLGRDMLLEGRFYGLRFPMGVRVGDVVDVERRLSGRRVRVWGWSYHTLEGHLERGRMHWEVWKWCDTGDVEFRIHAISAGGEIGSPIVRLGFALFGRWMQRRFYRRLVRRMDRLVASRLRRPPTGRAPCVPIAVGQTPTYGSADGRPAA